MPVFPTTINLEFWLLFWTSTISVRSLYCKTWVKYNFASHPSICFCHCQRKHKYFIYALISNCQFIYLLVVRLYLLYPWAFVVHSHHHSNRNLHTQRNRHSNLQTKCFTVNTRLAWYCQSTIFFILYFFNSFVIRTACTS